MKVDDSTRPTLVVFGASGTLGRAVVRQARRAGGFASVAACGFRREPDGDAVFQFDVLDSARLNGFAGELARRGLEASAVVNCIGATRDRVLPRTSLEDWNRVLELNLSAARAIARAFLPAWVSRRAGQFVFVGSHAGRSGRAGQASYSAAKAALAGFSQSLAREYGKRNVRSNVVLPGLLADSPMVEQMPAEDRALLEAENVLGGPSNPDEVAAFILHLLQMKRVSGQIFALDSRILPLF